MKRNNRCFWAVGTAIGFFFATLDADARQEPKPAPPGQPVAKAVSKAADSGKPGDALALPGLEVSVPKEWKREEVAAAPMAPQAVFRLPKADGDADDGMVRITHFPNMKGKDDINIERWLGQVTKADGKPHTKEEAKVVITDSDKVKLTVVDLTGNVKMTGWTEAKPNHRMIAAIVDHPQGPHYIVAGGGLKTMEKWAIAVDAFLKSAKVK